MVERLAEPASLPELVRDISISTLKVSAVLYPWLVGIMSEVHNRPFFEEAYKSLPFIAGVAIAEVMIHTYDNYKVKKDYLAFRKSISKSHLQDNGYS